MKKYRSEALMVSHQEAEWMHREGLISADEMREFDEACLIQEPETKEGEKPLKVEQVTA